MKKIIIPILIFLFAFSALAETTDLPDSGLTPDSPFYFLKVWKESIQTFFTFGEENKAKQYLHLAEVRLAEYQKMMEKGKTEIAQRTLEKYEKQLNRALDKLNQAKEKGKNVDKVLETVSQAILKHQDVLLRVYEKVSEQAKKGIENALEKSLEGYENAIKAISQEKKKELENKAKELKEKIKEKVRTLFKETK